MVMTTLNNHTACLFCVCPHKVLILILYVSLFSQGAYLLHLTWSDRQVQGSPFKVTIAARPNADKVTASGSALKMLVAHQTSRLVIDSREAGSGKESIICSLQMRLLMHLLKHLPLNIAYSFNHCSKSWNYMCMCFPKSMTWIKWHDYNKLLNNINKQ